MTDDSEAESTTEEGRMSMLDHLVELRRRLMWSGVAFIACFLVAYYFADPVFNFLNPQTGDATYMLIVEGQGVMWVAKVDLINSIERIEVVEKT